METNLQHKQSCSESQQRSAWFGSMIGLLLADEAAIEANIAPTHTVDLYNSLIFDDDYDIAKKISFKLHKKITFEIISAYLRELKINQVDLIKLGFDISGQEILVWSEINDDDWETEKKLYLIAATVTSNNKDTNYTISTTIVEKSENIDIPKHYILAEKK